MNSRTAKKLTAEFLGTALLVATVVGSGIMAQRLFPDSMGLALLANTIATGAGLGALILCFAPVSGAHFNPVVSLAAAMSGDLNPVEATTFALVQFSGALCGAWLSHLMFCLPVLQVSHHARSGWPMFLSELVATFSLVAVVRSTRGHILAPFAISSTIVAAYWFTPSTSFANPAVTLARGFTDTFTGIRPLDVPAFMVAQILGAVAATQLFGWLAPDDPVRCHSHNFDAWIKPEQRPN